jgi:peroxiredoxin
VSFKNFARTFFGCKSKNTLPAGAAAPPISLTSLDGQTLILAEALKTGPVLAAFFKVSCPTCQFTFPFLQRLYETYGGGNVTFWAISQNDAEDTHEFLDKYGVKFPVLLDDPGYPASNAYGLTNVPTIFLIAPDGKIQMSSVGFAKADIEKIAAEAARATGQLVNSVFTAGEKIPECKPG